MPTKGRSKKTSKMQEIYSNYLDKVNHEIESNQSRLSLVLGALILLVIGILIFNYFNKNRASLGPAQQSEQTNQTDVSADNLPGKYTVKEGDTLFIIAEKYYQDGNKFDMIAKANNLESADIIESDQVLQIPKLEQVQSSPTPSESPIDNSSVQKGDQLGTGGGNTTIWGSNIEGDTYTVAEGDWLSKIAARAYGDISAYKKIVDANNISNPDYIVPGQALKIPR